MQMQRYTDSEFNPLAIVIVHVLLAVGCVGLVLTSGECSNAHQWSIAAVMTAALLLPKWTYPDKKPQPEPMWVYIQGQGYVLRDDDSQRHAQKQ